MQLYKKNKETLLFWKIEVVKNKFRTIQGQVGGKLSTSKWTTCKGKNAGKANATTGPLQAASEASAKIQLKLDASYKRTLKEAKNTIPPFEPMLAHKYVAGKTVLQFPVLVQPKLDGIRAYITKDGIFSRKHKRFTGVPHIEEALKDFFVANPDVILDGELYNHALKDDFLQIVSIVKKKTNFTKEDLELSKKLVQFHCFDVFDSSNSLSNFIQRDLLTQTPDFCTAESVKRVHNGVVLNEEDLNSAYVYFQKEGYEGQIIRNPLAPYRQCRTTDLLKRKEFTDEEFEIVDVIEGKGNRSGMMGKLILKNDKGLTWESNMKGSFALYRALLKNKTNYIGKMATMKYKRLTPKGIPFHGIVTSIRDYED